MDPVLGGVSDSSNPLIPLHNSLLMSVQTSKTHRVRCRGFDPTGPCYLTYEGHIFPAGVEDRNLCAHFTTKMFKCGVCWRIGCQSWIGVPEAAATQAKLFFDTRQKCLQRCSIAVWPPLDFGSTGGPGSCSSPAHLLGVCDGGGQCLAERLGEEEHEQPDRRAQRPEDERRQRLPHVRLRGQAERVQGATP